MKLLVDSADSVDSDSIPCALPAAYVTHSGLHTARATPDSSSAARLRARQGVKTRQATREYIRPASLADEMTCPIVQQSCQDIAESLTIRSARHVPPHGDAPDTGRAAMRLHVAISSQTSCIGAVQKGKSTTSSGQASGPAALSRRAEDGLGDWPSFKVTQAACVICDAPEIERRG